MQSFENMFARTTQLLDNWSIEELFVGFVQSVGKVQLLVVAHFVSNVHVFLSISFVNFLLLILILLLLISLVVVVVNFISCC